MFWLVTLANLQVKLAVYVYLCCICFESWLNSAELAGMDLSPKYIMTVLSNYLSNLIFIHLCHKANVTGEKI